MQRTKKMNRLFVQSVLSFILFYFYDNRKVHVEVVQLVEV